MKRTRLWDIIGSEEYIYAAFKNRSDEGISVDRMWHDHWIQMCLVAFPPYAAYKGGIFHLLDAACIWITYFHSM